jgi:hypothetical protein
MWRWFPDCSNQKVSERFLCAQMHTHVMFTHRYRKLFAIYYIILYKVVNVTLVFRHINIC